MSDFTFDESADPEFKEVSNGDHLGIIEKTDVGASNGHPTVRCQFRIVTGDDKNRVISDWLHFTQAAAKRVRDKLIAAGVAVPSGLPDAEAYAVECARLLQAQRALITVEAEPYNGKISAKVKAWKTAPPQPETPVAVGTGTADDDDIPF